MVLNHDNPTRLVEKNPLRHWILSLFLLLIGITFAILVMYPQQRIGGIQFLQRTEFIIAYWILCFFCLTYGITRILLGNALSGIFDPLVAIMIFVISVVLALLVVPLPERELYIPQVLTLLFLPLLALLPVLLYVSFLSMKRKPLLDELLLNLNRIYSASDQSRDKIIEMYRQKFQDMFGAVNSLPTFQALLPIILTTMLISLGWLYIANQISNYFGAAESRPIDLNPVNYGFIGVYLFSLNFLFRRYVQSDLGPVAYSNVNLRLMTTVIWTMLLWNFEKDADYVNILAFSVGIFPDVGWQWLTKQLQAFTKVGVSDQSKNYPLNQITGMTIWIENRLLEENIENVHNLVTANLPELLLQTNYAPGRLVDWIDQAILQTHLSSYKKRPEDSLNAVADDLGLNGIATASGFINYYNDKCRPADPSGRLVRLASEIKNETNLYHITVWRTANRSLDLELIN